MGVGFGVVGSTVMWTALSCGSAAVTEWSLPATGTPAPVCRILGTQASKCLSFERRTAGGHHARHSGLSQGLQRVPIQGCPRCCSVLETGTAD